MNKMNNSHRKALNLAGEGQWDAAHELIQSLDDREACLIHAYLHRIEGDLGNARYWYRRAHEKFPDISPEDEFKRLHAMMDVAQSG